VLNLYNDKNGLLLLCLWNSRRSAYGFIWIATDNKLHRLDPSTGHFDYFDKNDGLFNNKIADGFHMSEEGELFIGFNGAINSINTANIAFNKKPRLFWCHD
jgi:hypothetical protein